MGVLVTAVVTSLATLLAQVVGGLTLATLLGSLLGLVLDFMFTGSLGIIDLVTSNDFITFNDVFSLLPYDNVNFKAIFITIAITATVTLSAWSFFKCVTAADEREVESPSQVIKRIIVTIIVLVVFIGVFMTNTVTDGNGGTTTIFNYVMSPFKDLVLNIRDKIEGADTAIQPYISGTFSSGYIAACILGFMLIKGCVSAAFILVERIVSLVVLMSFGPLAIACNASLETEEIFKKWWRTFLGTILALILSFCLIRVFADQMGTWINIEQQRDSSASESITLYVSDLDEAEYNTCTMGGINVRYYKTSNGFTRGDGLGDTTVYWTQSECSAGVKYVNTEGADTGNVTESAKTFATEANTYRLILAIAWITLCGESEKIIAALGFTSIVSGKMAKELFGAVHSAVGTISRGFREGSMAGRGFGSELIKNRAAVWGNRVRPAALAQGKGGADKIKSDSFKAGQLGNSIEANVKDNAMKTAEKFGKRMGTLDTYKNGLSDGQIANAIDNMGLTTSRGEIVSGKQRMGDGKEAKEIRRAAEESLRSGFDEAIRGKQEVLSSFANKSTSNAGDITKSLNDSYFSTGNIKATGNVGYTSLQDESGNNINALIFDGTVKDNNGVERDIKQALFVPTGEQNSFDTSFSPLDNRIELDDESGYVYYNKSTSNQEELYDRIDDLRESVSDSFDEMNQNVSAIYETVSGANDPSFDLTDEQIEADREAFFETFPEKRVPIDDDEESTPNVNISNETKSVKDFDPDEFLNYGDEE